MRIPPVTLYPIVPSVQPIIRKPEQPEEPISFCGHMRRLMAIQQRHMMLQRLWDLMVGFLRPQPARFERLV